MGSLSNRLRQLLGREGLLSLSQARGGRRAYIPRAIAAGHWIERALGRERAAAMARDFGGQHLEIPAGPARGLGLRNERIRLRRANGYTVRAIAAEFGLSERQVRNVLRG